MGWRFGFGGNRAVLSRRRGGGRGWRGGGEWRRRSGRFSPFGVFAEAEEGEEALEVIVAVVFDFDAAAFGAIVEDDVGSEVSLEPILDLLEGRGEGVGVWGRGASGGFGEASLEEVIGDEFFGGANGEMGADDFFGGEELFVGGFDGEEDFGVSDGEEILGEPGLELFVEVEEADGVGDGSATFADFEGDIFLAEMEFLGEAGEGFSFFDGVEVFALEIFDEGEFEDFLIGGFADDEGGFGEARALGGAPASFAGDEFEEIAAFAGDEGLDDAVFFDGENEFVEMFVAEDRAWLERGSDDALEGNDLEPFAIFDGGFWGSDPGIDESAVTFTECCFCHRGGEDSERWRKGNSGRLKEGEGRIRWEDDI